MSQMQQYLLVPRKIHLFLLKTFRRPSVSQPFTTYNLIQVELLRMRHCNITAGMAKAMESPLNRGVM